MKKEKIDKPAFHQQTLVVAALFAAFSASTQAAPMNFSQIPPGAGAREPSPNVIVTVDDSGSMGWDVNGCRTPDYQGNVFGDMDDPARAAGAPPCPGSAANPLPSRLANLRAAVRNTFGNPATGDRGIIADNRIRLAWQALDDTGKVFRPTGLNGDQDILTAGQPNTIRSFSGAHRTNFDTFLSSLRADSRQGTAAHKMMASVTNYMSTTGVNGPFAAVPGTTLLPELSCRRTFHILMTDGAWNSEDVTAAVAGNADGTARTFPDNTFFDVSSTNTQTRLYRDVFGGTKGTLADWAMLNWATDFQPAMANNIRALRPVTANETFGGVALSPYWNPKNNPQTWQGVTQYTIGFGNSATQWGPTPAWNSTTDDNYEGDFPNLVNGTVSWLDLFDGINDNNQRPSDLWHAALNGRGKYYPARTSQDLQQAFEDILDTILSQTTKPLVAIATSSSRLTKGAFAYIAKYNSENWSGDISAFALNEVTGTPSTQPTWSASALMDLATFDPATRIVLTHNGTAGKSFTWANLTTAQRASITGTGIGADSETVGTARVDYLRGDRSKEESNSGGYLRNRVSRLGDIVNSNIWFTGAPLNMGTDYTGHKAFRQANVGRKSMLYVGANDGMLHGFDGKTGKELLAYVPLGAFANLRRYTQPSYEHRYFVDGHPFTGDANLGGGASDWRTILVGSLGAGGKGYFLLDVTNPSAFTDPGTGTSNIVLADNTLTTDRDIGHIFGAPVVDDETSAISQQIVRLNNGRWAAILGNGYNSTDEKSVLLIQYLDGTRGIKKIVADSTAGSANGLGVPRTVDVDGNGTTDVVFAGDLKGNLWKFNLITTNDSGWGVSGWSNNAVCTSSTCLPFFIARDAAGTVQPITAAPLTLVHPLGGFQVIFGTGRDLVAADRNTTPTPQRQSTYAIWDKTVYTIDASTSTLISNGTDARITSGRSALVAQSSTTTDAQGRTSTTQNQVTYSRTDTAAKRGWYFDLPLSGERLLNNVQYFGGNSVLFNSVIPKVSIEGETCDLSSAKDRGFITVLDGISGKASKTSLFGASALPTATRTEFGTGEFASIVDLKSGRASQFGADSTCTSDCDDNGSPGTPSPPGAACVIGSGCEANSTVLCTEGVNCPTTTCKGAACACNGKLCEQIKPPPAPFSCTGPACRPRGCGTVIPGAVVDLCIPGLSGARTDWRELR